MIIQDKLVQSSEMTTRYSLHEEELALLGSLRPWESDHKTPRHYVPQCFQLPIYKISQIPSKRTFVLFVFLKNTVWSSKHSSWFFRHSSKL